MIEGPSEEEHIRFMALAKKKLDKIDGLCQNQGPTYEPVRQRVAEGREILKEVDVLRGQFEDSTLEGDRRKYGDQIQSVIREFLGRLNSAIETCADLSRDRN
jgi:hypothetical protein